MLQKVGLPRTNAIFLRYICEIIYKNRSFIFTSQVYNLMGFAGLGEYIWLGAALSVALTITLQVGAVEGRDQKGVKLVRF